MKISGILALCGLASMVAVSSGTGAAETLLERGAYLVNGIAGCGNCHTPRFGPKKGAELAGGFPFGGASGE